MLIRECNHELEKFPPIIANMQELQRRKDIKQELEKHKQGETINLTVAVPWVCLQFVIVVFPDHTHLLYFGGNQNCLSQFRGNRPRMYISDLL